METSPEKYRREAQMYLTNLSHENRNKFVIKHIYNDKVKKWKKMKNRKTKIFARIRTDVDSKLP